VEDAGRQQDIELDLGEPSQAVDHLRPAVLGGKGPPTRAVATDPVAPKQTNDPRRMLAEAAGGRIGIRGPQADDRTFSRTRCAALVPRGSCRSRALHYHGCEPAAIF
jgi:hypothetical protein